MTNEELLEWMLRWRWYCSLNMGIFMCRGCGSKEVCEQAEQEFKSLLEGKELSGRNTPSREPTDKEKEELARWFDRRITQLVMGLPENDWKYSDKQKAQKIRSLIFTGKKKE